MVELEIAIYSKLAADATLTGLLGGTAIYNGTAPQGAVYPYVTFSNVSEVDNYTLSAQATFDFLYEVKAVTKSPGGSPSRKAAGEIEARAKAVLNDTTLTVSGRTLLSIRKQSGFTFDEIDSGVIYSHAGGNYRIWLA